MSKLAETTEIPGRRDRRKKATRAKLLQAASKVMAHSSVDGATIKGVTEAADVGFGTFYTYFDGKESLAAALLDCMINDIARRAEVATAALQRAKCPEVPAVRTRLLVRTAMTDPVWRWWAERPMLLFDRLNHGIGPYAKADLVADIRGGLSGLSEDELESAWRLAVWTMVGGIHDVVHGDQPFENEVMVTEAVLRLLGTDAANARLFATTVLPELPPADIDWDFVLSDA
jgi:AcrR family transcriptional regulator